MAAVEEQKGNLTDYANCLCSRDGGMSGGSAPKVVYQSPKNVAPGKIVRDEASVSTVQKWLNQQADGKKPDTSLKEDGKWGTGTSAAFYRRMIELQEKNGISPTGKYDKDTAEAMRKSGFGKEADALDKMKQEGTLDRLYNHRLAKVACEGKDAARPQPPAAGQSGFSTIINKTDREADVSRLQGSLGMTKTGKMDIEVIGEMDKRIKEGQARAGLEQTGKYDGKTAEAMRKDPQSKDLAGALDNLKRNEIQREIDKVSKEIKEIKGDRGPQTPATDRGQNGFQRLDQGGPGELRRLDQGGVGSFMHADFVMAGGIQSDIDLPASFEKANLHTGSVALDRPQPVVQAEVTLESDKSPVYKAQQNNLA